MFNKITKQIQFGRDTVTLETGQIARQATAAVMVRIGNTEVLVTVVGKKEADPNKPFFPLTVNYQEKTYAAGRIPGGFFKREGRPSEKETLTCRLIDRPIRPLFPKGFMNEVQVVATVMSADKNQDPDIAALIGTSAALSISGIPFGGPIGAARVGFKDGMYILNPSRSELEESALDLVVAGTEPAVLMVESEAKELSEDQMLGAVLFGHMEMQPVIQGIKEFAAEVGTPTWEWQPATENTELKNAIKEKFEGALGEAYTITEKMARYAKVGELRDACVEAFATGEEGAPEAGEVKELFGKVEKSVVREAVVSGKPRIDGRALDAVRAIECEVGVLAKTHGSALFTRGETQAIVTATLGGMRDAQFIDALEGSRQDHFMLQYNFPPYCVGETGMIGSPKRREIGHGRLARRGVEAVVPDEKAFPYSIRVVSEITESNGSSSMASVCGTSMALMDAGVPLTAPVAGIAMGLVKEEDGRFAVLSDILGDEDHLGDMDFKVAGTARGVTALQMDIKIEGITEEIMEKALEQANAGRIHILGEMAKAIAESRTQVSDNAPTLLTLKINPDKIRDVIGKGGATIRALTDETGCTIDLEDDGSVKIYGETREKAEEAVRRVEEITAEAEVGAIYEGKVTKVVDFGAFVAIMPGTEGLLHISQIAEERVEKVSDYVNEGDLIKVKVLDVDQRGRIKLSMKEAKEG
ncbi:MAG TPA: polyribonucleotide nucleotidyltransferase [Alcanivorax sp.]|jgi:polyribonucleotide nucleotidyltransferase|uniref:polyribonucleotide nucleotidyltransferase n=1 Tax=Alcanivorax TaxID=59753 RepID=UPI000C6BD8D3|nr:MULTISPECIES: polyribonucleotide nucleotidyltransferase [Alcanivorax]MAC16411.1 polyribonucleotide nucleotidyltransferase [Alcanivorax sp.]MBG33584.1 polyribonucleotide nucleotidyltransferase [Alcanivorax sp.]MDF1637987.1 polyribonucleotide nucleotidyltransferase [Alcanivorax jadensis]HBC17505.1 polyribonucleotide nucleotidyltransferase [Alcanivorax sp.]|tara:strand:+ start:1790 stop:3883 length:2094 start_codon:yes stop_codon:yes gene_type:complete